MEKNMLKLLSNLPVPLFGVIGSLTAFSTLHVQASLASLSYGDSSIAPQTSKTISSL